MVGSVIPIGAEKRVSASWCVFLDNGWHVGKLLLEHFDLCHLLLERCPELLCIVFCLCHFSTQLAQLLWCHVGPLAQAVLQHSKACLHFCHLLQRLIALAGAHGQVAIEVLHLLPKSLNF